MAQQPKKEPVHFGYMMRRMMECLPPDVEGFGRQSVLALCAFSNGWHWKDELEVGIVGLSGTVSYQQIADFCGISRATAKWRLEQMRDRWQLLEWKRTKYGIAYEVFYRIPKEQIAEDVKQKYGIHTANGLAASTPELAEENRGELPSQLTGAPSQLTDKTSQLIGGSESANGLAPLSLSVDKSVSNMSDQSQDLQPKPDQPRSSRSEAVNPFP